MWSLVARRAGRVMRTTGATWLPHTRTLCSVTPPSINAPSTSSSTTTTTSSSNRGPSIPVERSIPNPPPIGERYPPQPIDAPYPGWGTGVPRDLSSYFGPVPPRPIMPPANRGGYISRADYRRAWTEWCYVRDKVTFEHRPQSNQMPIPTQVGRGIFWGAMVPVIVYFLLYWPEPCVLMLDAAEDDPVIHEHLGVPLKRITPWWGTVKDDFASVKFWVRGPLGFGMVHGSAVKVHPLMDEKDSLDLMWAGHGGFAADSPDQDGDSSEGHDADGVTQGSDSKTREVDREAEKVWRVVKLQATFHDSPRLFSIGNNPHRGVISQGEDVTVPGMPGSYNPIPPKPEEPAATEEADPAVSTADGELSAVARKQEQSLSCSAAEGIEEVLESESANDDEWDD